MSEQEASTAIHRLVERCRRADYAPVVARLRSGWVVLGERQMFRGYCLLLPDPVVSHLNALAAGARSNFLDDMAAVGDALLAVTAAVRINYALYGNVEPALHAHLFPRCADEPAATRSAHPWALDWSLAPLYDASYRELQAQIAGGLSNRLIEV